MEKNTGVSPKGMVHGRTALKEQWDKMGKRKGEVWKARVRCGEGGSGERGKGVKWGGSGERGKLG